MKIQYRTAYRGGSEWFPQVRFKKWLFWSAWKRIGKHTDGFGLYDLPNWNHPQSKYEAEQTIIDYDVWITNQQKGFALYYPYYINMKNTQ